MVTYFDWIPAFWIKRSLNRVWTAFEPEPNLPEPEPKVRFKVREFAWTELPVWFQVRKNAGLNRTELNFGSPSAERFSSLALTASDLLPMLDLMFCENGVGFSRLSPPPTVLSGIIFEIAEHHVMRYISGKISTFSASFSAYKMKNWAFWILDFFFWEISSWKFCLQKIWAHTVPGQVLSHSV